MIDTFPEVTLKSSESNEATPFTDVEALSAVIVIILLVTAADIEFEPVTNKASVNKEITSFPVEPLILKSVTNPVSCEPSPMNEPVKFVVPATSPILSAETLPVPKSVA